MSNQKEKIAYFVDFDNTIAAVDVGNTVLERFANPSLFEYDQMYCRGELTSADCIRLQYEGIEVNPQVWKDFVLSLAIDPFFTEFQTLAKAKNRPLTILSDGLDIYVHPFLEKYNLRHLPLYCNKAEFINNKLTVSFPYQNPECKGNCANCKSQHLSLYPEHKIVYIGDGYSDVCAALKADFVYAKASLLAVLKAKQIKNYKPFTSFADIIAAEELKK